VSVGTPKHSPYTAFCLTSCKAVINKTSSFWSQPVGVMVYTLIMPKGRPHFTWTDYKFSLSIQHPVPHHFLFTFTFTCSGKCILYKKCVISCETTAVAK